MMSPILGSNNIDRDETMISPISKINAGDANMGDDSASTMISLSTNLDADAGSFEMSDLAQETKKIGRKTRSTSRKENNKKSKFEEGGVKKTIAKAPRKKQQLYSIPKSPFLTMDQ